ncbi:alkaline phosphatase family protein [Candidatus Binatia bacterium]|jgi:phospholipase C|nr:alkaline phosphatase family protein [Candidatus Binatia bacterium]
MIKKKIEERIAETALSRREFLAGMAAATGALAVGGCGDSSSGGSDPESEPLPDPTKSGIEHVVVLMMENRSFDHMLGWLPDADGAQAGLEFVDKQGNVQQTWELAPEFQGCQYGDPDHGYKGGRIQFDDGACDGWLRASTNDNFPIGYYRQQDLSFYGGAVPAWTTLDRYFCAILSSTFPNRMYMHAGQTDRLTNTLQSSTLPAIWDRVASAGLSGAYYYNDLPVTALFGTRFLPISHPYEKFLEDAAAGNLANVVYVDPHFISEDLGTSNDDHPFADIRNGQIFVNQVYEALTQSPNWENTVFIVNYDEWGGFFDHVPPPLAPLTEEDPIIGNDGRLGFRTPTLIASPLARRGFVGHQQYDHTSILSMIEWRWGLAPLTVRDQTANNIAHVLDFGRKKNFDVPRFTVPQGPYDGSCAPEAAALHESLKDVRGLRAKAAALGFYLP